MSSVPPFFAKAIEPWHVIDTWTDCRETATGWTGIDGNGCVVNVVNHPDAWASIAAGPARIPGCNRLMTPNGIILLERRRRARAKAKKKAPARK
jgi:hypothetical protein